MNAQPARFLTLHHNTLATRIGLVLLILALGWPAWADKVITKNGQNLEGLLKEENPYYVKIDVKGVIIPVPRERVKEILKNTREENARALLDRAMDSLTRNDVATARTLVEQAHALNVSDSALLDSIAKMDQEISEMERTGGTPEERRQRAQALLQRASEAYDKIRIEEGNQLLIQTLKVDPSYEPAHQKLNQLLNQKKPDLMLAAQYFTEILAPNNIKMDSPVIPLLPTIYTYLSEQFEHSADMHKAAYYAKMLKQLAESFASHPSWQDSADAPTKALLAKPVDELLIELIRNNIVGGQYDLAVEKLQGWTQPDANPATTLLYIRAYTGGGQFKAALAALESGIQKFPDAQELRTQYNAMKLLTQADQAQKQGDVKGAVATYETIFESRANLAPEIGETVGRLLAKLRAPEMETSLTAAPGWKAADVAALVMRYGQDPALKRRAAEITVSTIQAVPWHLDLNWSINGNKVTLPEELTKQAAALLTQPLAVRFDQQSPFILHLNIDAIVPDKAAEAAQALNAGQPLAAPAPVKTMKFVLEAEHTSLGTIFKASWTPAPQAQAAPAAGQTPTPTPTPTPAAPPPGAPPMPGMMPMPGGPGGPGAPAPAAPVAPATPAPGANPLASPTPTPAAAAAATPTPAPVTSEYLVIASMDSIKTFIAQSLVKSLSPDVILLPMHLFIPMAQDILREEAQAAK